MNTNTIINPWNLKDGTCLMNKKRYFAVRYVYDLCYEEFLLWHPWSSGGSYYSLDNFNKDEFIEISYDEYKKFDDDCNYFWNKRKG